MLRNINEKLNGKNKLTKQGTAIRSRLMHGRILQLGSSENLCLSPISNCYLRQGHWMWVVAVSYLVCLSCSFAADLPLRHIRSFFLSNYSLLQEAVAVSSVSSLSHIWPDHLWTICSADFLNVLPRLLFSYYCLAIAAARLDCPICCCCVAPFPPELGYNPDASFVAFIPSPPAAIVGSFFAIP